MGLDTAKTQTNVQDDAWAAAGLCGRRQFLLWLRPYMADTLRIKRWAAGGAAGAPSSLAAAELAYNEQDDTLYYGKGNSGGSATSILPIGGPGYSYQL